MTKYTLFYIILYFFPAILLRANESPEELDDILIYHKSFISNFASAPLQNRNLTNGNLESSTNQYYYSGLLGLAKRIHGPLYINFEFNISTNLLQYKSTVIKDTHYIRIDGNQAFTGNREVIGKKIDSHRRIFLGLTWSQKSRSIFRLNYRLLYSMVFADNYIERRIASPGVSVGPYTLYDHNTEFDLVKRSDPFHGVSGEVELEVLIGNSFSIPFQVRLNHLFLPNHFQENDRILGTSLNELWLGTGINFRI